jgi:cation:H+ antiporter
MIENLFSTWSLPVNLLLFCVFAAIIGFAGTRLTFLADRISEQYRISRSSIGLVFLAFATSLPEVATTLSGAVSQNQSLVLNNLFGGIALQTAILGIADGFTRGAISNYPRKADHALEAVVLVALLSVVLIVLFVGEHTGLFHIGFGSLLISLAYIGAIWLLRKTSANDHWVPVDLSDITERSTASSAAKSEQQSEGMLAAEKLIGQTILCCVAILVAGIALVANAENIALKSGLGDSFVGVTLLAGATSLPELTTTIAAVRMGAYTLAISNIFGSNLIMLALLLPADLLYLRGPILHDADGAELLAIATGILVTAVYIAGLLIRRKPRIGSYGVDSFVVIVVYLLSVWLLYLQR